MGNVAIPHTVAKIARILLQDSSSLESGLAGLEKLQQQVTRNGFTGVKGFDLIVSEYDSNLKESFALGRVSSAHYGFVKDGVHMGFDFNVIHEMHVL